jgi:Tol biopolymer transport system component
MANPVPLLPDTLADRYAIDRELGKGGMATVYLADDLRHDRKVALKVLRPEVAAMLGADRFIQEIKTTAQLQHPHILPLFDSGEADGFLYYVMPYVEGETLRQKLSRETQLPIEDAVRIASEVADALQYAHEQGIIHRDIKPENILLHNGRAMVVDFGIALALSAAAGGRMTETGLSLGTPHYMSPEQATAERNITNRSDVYSLGCVLYEMLTGDPPYTASSAQAIISKIVIEQARPVTDLRKSVPPHVAAVVARSLAKLPADRFATASAFAAALHDPTFTTGMSVSGGGPTARRPVVTSFLVALLVVATVLVAWGWLRPGPTPPTTREWIGLSLIRPGGALYDGWSQNLALAPDGSAIVFGDSTRARAVWQLFLKEAGRDTAVAIPGTDGGAGPFFSPDGEWIGFTTGRGLFKIPRKGGAPVELSDSTAWSGLASGVWLDDGSIVFPDRSNRRLFQIDADGGHQRVVLPARQWGIVRQQALPQGRGVLFTTCGAQPCSPGRVSLLDLRHGRVVPLLNGVSSGWYLRTGHLLYGRPDGTLFAQRLDLDRGTLTGAAMPVLEGLATTGGLPSAVVSPGGTILYASRGSAGALASGSRLLWVDRHGTASAADTALPLPGSAQEIFGVRLSPEGNRLAFVQNTEDGAQVFVQALPDGPITRLTHGGGGSVRPEWSPDGRDLVYVRYRDDAPTIAARQRADGADTAAVILEEARSVAEVLISPDAKWLVYRTETNTSGGGDVLARPLSGDTTTLPLLTSPAFEGEPAISPDGRWLAYVSDEGGTDEVYVRPWPDVNGGRWQISHGGGTEPVWNPDSRELYYRSMDQVLMAVRVDPSSPFHASQPESLFSAAPYITGGGHAAYAVSRDGRFLFGQQSGEGVGASRLILVRHWFAELRPLLKGR